MHSHSWYSGRVGLLAHLFSLQSCKENTDHVSSQKSCSSSLPSQTLVGMSVCVALAVPAVCGCGCNGRQQHGPQLQNRSTHHANRQGEELSPFQGPTAQVWHSVYAGTAQCCKMCVRCVGLCLLWRERGCSSCCFCSGPKCMKEIIE